MTEFVGPREDYGAEALAEADLLPDPIAQFELWLAEATEAGLFEPSAFVLGTVSNSGGPQARTVLLRRVSAGGFQFFTNYESRKGEAITLNPKVSMVFGWYPLFRQVLVEGVARRLSDAESDAYFATRPRESQLGAWASRQSASLDARADLDLAVEEVGRRFEGFEEIPRPPFWGGYGVIPLRIEFWKGRSSRLHDRIVFERDAEGGAWRIGRLQP